MANKTMVFMIFLMVLFPERTSGNYEGDELNGQ